MNKKRGVGTLRATVGLLTCSLASDRFDDFEAMFPGGKGEAAALDFAALCEKPDLDQALIDCMM